MKKLTKIEIIRLFYGSEDEVKEPNFQWKNDAEAIGINPEEYVIEKDTMQLVNIYELYNALYEDEIHTLKETLALYKQKLYGSLKLSDFMIAPNSYEFYGNPQNRNESYFFKLLNQTDWANINAYEYAKIMAQGDTKQPLNTEELIHHYAKHDPIIIDENTLSKMNEIDISINEWKRSMIIKALLDHQKTLKTDIPNHNDIILSDKMPKKFTYGQCIIYNKTKDKYCKDGVWIDKTSIKPVNTSV